MRKLSDGASGQGQERRGSENLPTTTSGPHPSKVEDMDTVPHGTLSGYNHHRCRCDACRAASSRSRLHYRRANPATDIQSRQSRAARLAAGELPEVPHGVYSTYVEYRCRCDLCRTANADNSARTRARRKAAK